MHGFSEPKEVLLFACAAFSLNKALDSVLYRFSNSENKHLKRENLQRASHNKYFCCLESQKQIVFAIELLSVGTYAVGPSFDLPNPDSVKSSNMCSVSNSGPRGESYTVTVSQDQKPISLCSGVLLCTKTDYMFCFRMRKIALRVFLGTHG